MGHIYFCIPKYTRQISTCTTVDTHLVKKCREEEHGKLRRHFVIAKTHKRIVNVPAHEDNNNFVELHISITKLLCLKQQRMTTVNIHCTTHPSDTDTIVVMLYNVYRHSDARDLRNNNYYYRDYFNRSRDISLRINIAK